MIRTPLFNPRLHLEVIPGQGVLVLADGTTRVLRGNTYEEIVPLIDGSRGSDEIVTALKGRMDAAKAYYILALLEKHGHIVESTPETRQEKDRPHPADPPEPTRLDKLADTARWIAAARAAESARPDRLFTDPWADALAGPEGKALLERFDETRQPLALRTRFFDDFLLAAAQTARQIVIVAAGMDTRAYRLDWPTGTRIFELDQPEVLAPKEQTLTARGATPNAQRQVIGVDLNQNWETALLAAGFDPHRPSAWLLEGLLVYLTAPQITRLLDRVTALAAPDSRLGMDMVNQGMLTSALSRGWLERLRHIGAPWRFGTDTPEQLLATHGWTATRSPLRAIAPRYGRTPPMETPPAYPNAPDGFFVTATIARTKPTDIASSQHK